MSTTTMASSASSDEINPHLIPIKKDPEMIRIEVLTNLIKMFAERGHINKTNIPNLINKIKKKESTDTYLINLDNPIKNELTNPKFQNNVIAIKLIHQKIAGITKIPVIKDFFDEFTNNHKIFIFDGISDKAKSTLMMTPNTEVFIESFLMINLVEHIDSPRYEVLNEEDTKELLDSYFLKKKELPKILTIDPVVSYFNLKRGNIIRIIRYSEKSGYAIAYRIVAKGN